MRRHTFFIKLSTIRSRFISDKIDRILRTNVFLIFPESVHSYGVFFSHLVS